MSNDSEAATKVVINAKYGGFGLSDEATREYLRRTGREWTETEIYSGLVSFEVIGDDDWYQLDIPRTDPVLVALVEEWGERANGDCASLEIVELPKGTLYMIDEYDGRESIQVRDGMEWSVA